VFALQDIAAGHLIWRSDDLAMHVVRREYRREVCAQCFSYDHGRDLKVRDNSVGFAFCTAECQDKWRQEIGETGVQAWTAVAKLVKGRGKEDDEMVDMDLPRPTQEEIIAAWDSIEVQAALIRVARMAESPQPTGVANESNMTERNDRVQITKQHRKAIQKALQQRISPDEMSFCVSGLIWHHNRPHEWVKVLALADDKTPYTSADDLDAFTRTYLQLLALLPLPLLPLLTPETLMLFSSRDSHNAFGIRSLEDEGSEFFGYGCWPAASYFNHSCGPNLRKTREGRVWLFRADKPIVKGEELNITYLSGEERVLSKEKRMEILKRSWAFDCGCQRCRVVS
jgi:hypothetical protein